MLATKADRLTQGIEQRCANAIESKPNQIGTITECMDVIKLAKQNGYRVIMSHRSGDTEDTTIADLAVGLNMSQIKTGAPIFSQNTAKHNRLLRIEEELGSTSRVWH